MMTLEKLPTFDTSCCRTDLEVHVPLESTIPEFYILFGGGYSYIIFRQYMIAALSFFCRLFTFIVLI